MIPKFAVRIVCGNPIVSPFELVPNAVWYILLAILIAVVITAVVLKKRKRAERNKRAGGNGRKEDGK